MTKAWQPLQRGDKIAVVFPSHRPRYQSTSQDITGTPATEIVVHEKEIMGMGLEPLVPGDLSTIEEWGERQDAARKRAQHIIDALNNPEVKAIYATGGHGADEVILELEKHYSNPANLPKRIDAPPLLGFSDVTQLQLYLGEKGLVSPVQVSVPLGHPNVRELLFAQTLPQNIPLIPINDTANKSTQIAGKMIGGSDLAAYNAHRSAYRLQTSEERNNILLLEGRFVDPDLIKTLEILQTQGQTANIKAIVLGQCYDNSGYERIHECDISKIKEISQKHDLPIFFGAPFGHTKAPPAQNSSPRLNFLPLPLNTDVVIKSENGKCSFSVSPVRTKEDVDAAKAEYALRTPWQPQETKDSNAVATASPVFQTIQFSQINPSEPTAIPGNFIGCCLDGRDIPAIEGVDVSGKDVLINSTIPGGGAELDYWSLIQKATMPMMELVKMDKAQDIKSITFSAPIAFPEGTSKN